MAVAGPAHLYSLNTDHLAAPYIVGLCQLKNQLRQRVTELVQRWSVHAEAVILFGSAARGEMRPASDIDLFVVRPDSVDEDGWLEQAAELAERVSAWTGNDARVIEMTPEEVRDGLHEGDGLLRAIRDEGQVDKKASLQLGVLLDMKAKAEYSARPVSGTDRKKAVRAATALVELARDL